MDVSVEVARIEKRVKGAGHTVTDLLKRASVDVAQWQRWKTGKQTPLMTTWGKITDAADEIAPEHRASA